MWPVLILFLKQDNIFCACVYLTATTPWFEAYRENFLQSMPASEHEFLSHYLACIL